LETEPFADWLAAASLKSESIDDRSGGWLRVTRGPPTGAGQWSHLYGSADNSAFGGESLGGVKSADELEVQWIGRPGPRYQSDRGNRKPSPLSTAGRLFLQGWRRMLAVDAYNGSLLWSLEIADLERFNMPRDCSNWCADDRWVFAAVRDRCWRINAADGTISRMFPVQAARSKEAVWDWGYVAHEGDLLLGSAVPQGTAWTNIWGGSGEGWYDAQGGPVTFPVCSDSLFALDKESGETRWRYEDGVILNPTITIGGGHVYFLECRNPEIVDGASRRIGTPQLWQELRLVAIEVATGEKVWDRPLEAMGPQIVSYLAYAKDRLVLVTSAGGKHRVDVFETQAGQRQWNAETAWLKGDHGGHMSRPAIVENTLYVRPSAFDLYTGQRLAQQMPNGGCGTYACATSALIFRAGTVTLWDRETAVSTTWNRLRPDCWLSTIPAGGMLLSPEGGGGCSCGSWMETSLGFAPREATGPKSDTVTPSVP